MTWRDDDQGTGTLGAIGCLLGLGLIYSIWRKHRAETTARRYSGAGRADLGWGTLALLAALAAVLILLT